MIICYSIDGLQNTIFHYAIGHAYSKINRVKLLFELRDSNNPKYHNPQTKTTIERWFSDGGLSKIEVFHFSD